MKILQQSAIKKAADRGIYFLNSFKKKKPTP